MILIGIGTLVRFVAMVVIILALLIFITYVAITPTIS